MPHNRYRDLPLETLYELIVQVVGDLLSAADRQSSNFNATLKELNFIYAAILERKNQTTKKEK